MDAISNLVYYIDSLSLSDRDVEGANSGANSDRETNR